MWFTRSCNCEGDRFATAVHVTDGEWTPGSTTQKCASRWACFYASAVGNALRVLSGIFSLADKLTTEIYTCRCFSHFLALFKDLKIWAHLQNLA